MSVIIFMFVLIVHDCDICIIYVLHAVIYVL